jgi:hypothetical protein
MGRGVKPGGFRTPYGRAVIGVYMEPDLRLALERRAAINERSLSAEVVGLIEFALEELGGRRR